MACECEGTAQSEFDGPGAITTPETLLRLVYHDECIRADGSLEPSRFPKSDFDRYPAQGPCERGFSVNRQAHANDEILIRKARDHQARAKVVTDRREVWTYAVPTDDLRALVANDGTRSVCVVDRAEADDPSHAELWGGRPGRTKSELRQIRDQVVTVLRKDRKILG
jgi:hypothetical protein